MKADFFALFPKFSTKTFTPKLYISIFRKTGLILYNPSIVLNKMKEYSGVQDMPTVESSDDKSIGFVTLLPPIWSEFKILIINTSHY